MKINILGVDPSLSNLGLAFATYDTDTGDVQVADLQLVQTECQTGKTVRKNSDDLRRARSLVEGLAEAAKRADIAIAEIPGGGQSASAVKAFGICIGVLAGCPIPLIEVSPSEAKVAAIGHKTATKAEMIEWAIAKHPNAPWLLRKSGGVMVPKNDNEHLADACAIIEAGVKTPEFRAAASMFKRTMDAMRGRTAA